MRLKKNPWNTLLGILRPSSFSPRAADWYPALLLPAALREDSPTTESTDPTEMSPENAQDISKYSFVGQHKYLLDGCGSYQL